MLKAALEFKTSESEGTKFSTAFKRREWVENVMSYASVAAFISD
jgi:hypothetical protein